MEIYRNSYFYFSLGFEKGWRIFSWRNRKKAPLQPELHQRSDDDLPESDGSYKALFLAFSLVKESPEIISSQCSMEVHLHHEGFNLEDRLPPAPEELSRSFKKTSVLGKDAQALETQVPQKK